MGQRFETDRPSPGRRRLWVTTRTSAGDEEGRPRVGIREGAFECAFAYPAIRTAEHDAPASLSKVFNSRVGAFQHPRPAPPRAPANQGTRLTAAIQGHPVLAWQHGCRSERGASVVLCFVWTEAPRGRSALQRTATTLHCTATTLLCTALQCGLRVAGGPGGRGRNVGGRCLRATKS